MSDEDFNQKIKDYLKETLELSIYQGDIMSYCDKERVTVRLLPDGELISEDSYDV